MAVSDEVRIDPSTSREAEELKTVLRCLKTANDANERLLAWANSVRSGDTDAGNTYIETMMGADVGDGSTLYTAIAAINTALDNLEDEMAKITWTV